MYAHNRDDAVAAADMLGRYGACDHCLGRLFAGRPGLSFYAHAGRRLRRAASGGKLSGLAGSKCYICRGLCDRIPEVARLAMSASEGYEFDTFSVGSVIKPSILDRDDRIRSEYRLRGSDSVKAGLTREVARRFAKATGSIHEKSAPEISVTVQPADDYCEVCPKPVAVYGRYTKHERGIPQKQDRCGSCLGRGCYACHMHGMSGNGSVEGQISELLFDVLGGTTAGFTWVGGEDKDSLVCGRGRPFFARIQRPRRRHIGGSRRRVRLGGVTLHGLRDVPLSDVGPIKFSSRVVMHVVMRLGDESTTTMAATTMAAATAPHAGGKLDNNDGDCDVPVSGIAAGSTGDCGVANVGHGSGPESNDTRGAAPVLRGRADAARLQGAARPGFLRALKRLASRPVSVLSKNNRHVEKTIHCLAYRRCAHDSFVMMADLDGGIPIKRLVTGEGVSPSVSGILGIPCECIRFDFEDVWTEYTPRRGP